LVIFDLITKIGVLGFIKIEDGQKLSVVRNKGLTDHFTTSNELLKNLKSDLDDISVSGIQSSLNGDNKLGNDGENLGSTSLEHFISSHNGEESVGIHLFSETVNENRKVVVVVQLFWADLPLGLRDGTLVINLNGEVTSVVIPSEFCNGDNFLVESSRDCAGGKNSCFLRLRVAGLPPIPFPVEEKAFSVV